MEGYVLKLKTALWHFLSCLHRALLTLEFALLTAGPKLKAVVSINDSLMTSDPTLLSFVLTRFWTKVNYQWPFFSTNKILTSYST
ncbi:MAG TPA: hypothetical protein DEO86_14900 [Colwellia sp.]|nr:hypothetical protein [Colwellia sp.]